MNPDHEFLQVTETSLPLTKRSVVMQNSAAPGHCRFGLCTDSHYAEKEALEDKHYAEALLKMEEFVRTANGLQLDFVIHLGDFKDEDLVPDPKCTLDYLRKMEEEYARFRGRRFHCLGNHDLDSITKSQFLGHVENAGQEKALGYYSFELNSIRFLVLDANFDAEGKDHFFREGGDWQDPVLPAEQVNWLQAELASSELPCVIFCHHPLFAYVKNGHSYHVSNCPEVRSVLEASGKVLAVFNGHMHEEMFHEINGIQYLAMNSMLEGTFVQRNCFYVVEITEDRLRIERFARINAYL